jgi:mercuric ion binding protein
MKFIAAFFLVFSAGQLFAQNKKETIVIKTQVYCDHCKICETCGGKMETDLYYIKGIKRVNYKEENMTIAVTYKPKKITPDKIRQEISKLGFMADDVPADPQAYEKLDECCKRK